MISLNNARLMRGEEVERWEESLAALPSGRRIRKLKELLSISYNNNISALDNLLREVAML